MQRFLLLILLGFFVLGGCEKTEERGARPVVEKEAQRPSPALATVPFLQESLAAVRVESTTESLLSWRSFRTAEPALIMLSNDPFVAPIPQELQSAVETALSEATEEELREAVDHLSPNPLLLPSMTVRAALENNLFSRLVWVLPVKNSNKDFSWKQVRQQLREENFPNAEKFSVTESGLSGMVGDTVIDIVHLGTLPSFSDPALVHIDLSYFVPLYDGEIKTPLYSLLYRTLATLRDADWHVAEATVCPGNATGRLPLDTRFFAADLETIIQEPSLLDSQPPMAWRQRAQALYLENFMQSAKIHEIYQKLEETHPSDASIKFALYQALRKRKRGTEALEKLDQAVAIDPVYGREYLNLAPVALEKDTPKAAIEMLQKAVQTFPQDPFVKLSLARAYMSLDMEDHARPLMKEIEQLDWSPVYYPDLNRMASAGG